MIKTETACHRYNEYDEIIDTWNYKENNWESNVIAKKQKVKERKEFLKEERKNNVEAALIKKYIKKRNQIVKILQEIKLEKTEYISVYGWENELEYDVKFEIEFNQACQSADLILQKMGMNKPTSLIELEKRGYLTSYISNRELNKKRLKQ